MHPDLLFITFASPQLLPEVQRLLASLRAFGGELAQAPAWVFAEHPEELRGLATGPTHLLRLVIPDQAIDYPFASTVAACAHAEELAPPGLGSLAWIDPTCLVVAPPRLYKLGEEADAAFRPVHIRNVGLPTGAAPDPFWSGIDAALGVERVDFTVESFIDGQHLRAYFNTHAFAINPELGLLRRWQEVFLRLVSDRAFQESGCTDRRHPVFLFQALLSTLAAVSIPPERLRLLPPTYNYPYNLHARTPAEHRPAALNELVTLTYEDRSIDPDEMTDIQVYEPLRSWLGDPSPGRANED
jgi:hypothetical protein